MRIIYIIGLLFIMPLFSQAQSKGNLAGEVVDKNTQKPIYGASVQLVNTKFVTQTDSLGKYIFKGIPTGQYHVLINSLGSLPYHLYNVIVGSGNINYVTAELTVQENVLKEVVVGNVKKTYIFGKNGIQNFWKMTKKKLISA